MVKKARPSDSPTSGDAIVSVDGSDAYIEIKECHAAEGKSGTINQVRAIKYITCVISAPGHGCWYVISPDQLVGIAASKNRGQHTEIPFESMNFGLGSLPDEFHETCDDQTLSETVHEAVRRGRQHTEVEKTMQELYSEITDLKDAIIRRVRKLM